MSCLSAARGRSVSLPAGRPPSSPHADPSPSRGAHLNLWTAVTLPSQEHLLAAMNTGSRVGDKCPRCGIQSHGSSVTGRPGKTVEPSTSKPTGFGPVSPAPSVGTYQPCWPDHPSQAQRPWASQVKKVGVVMGGGSLSLGPPEPPLSGWEPGAEEEDGGSASQGGHSFARPK